MLKRFSGLTCGLLLSLLANAALADVVVVVSSESSVESLSRALLTDIYMGRTTTLPGGSTITPIDQSERSAAHEAFYQAYLGRSAAQVKAHWSRLIFTGRGQPPRSVSNSEAVAEIVSQNPNTVGYIDRSQVSVGDRLRIVNIE